MAQTKTQLENLKKGVRFGGGQPFNFMGRPRKLSAEIMLACKEAGIESVSQTEVSEMIATMLNMRDLDIKEIAESNESPVAWRTVAAYMAKAAGRKEEERMLNFIFDRAHGKLATNSKVELTGKDGKDFVLPVPIIGIPASVISDETE